MIAIVEPSAIAPLSHPKSDDQKKHDQFLQLLPAIRRHARFSFQSLDQEARDEAVQEVIANAWRTFVRLWEQGRGDLAYAGPLARYGVSRVRDGRCVGGSWNVHDVSSRHCQRRKGIRLERLDDFDKLAGGWKEVVVEDGKATPADIAAVRIDFQEWLRSLPAQLRGIALTLASGESTQLTARHFGLSPGRISQLRRDLERAWHSFQQEHRQHGCRARQLRRLHRRLPLTRHTAR